MKQQMREFGRSDWLPGRKKKWKRFVSKMARNHTKELIIKEMKNEIAAI